MRFVLIALIALLVACAPDLTAYTGEIVYEVRLDQNAKNLCPISNCQPNSTTDVAGIYLTVCLLGQTRGGYSPAGYSSFDVDYTERSRLFPPSSGRYGTAYISKRADGNASIRMIWVVRDSGWPYARLTLRTESDDPSVNIRDVEKPWFQCLERSMTRVASAR
jgi:hypothetical protein